LWEKAQRGFSARKGGRYGGEERTFEKKAIWFGEVGTVAKGRTTRKGRAGKKKKKKKKKNRKRGFYLEEWGSVSKGTSFPATEGFDLWAEEKKGGGGN